MTIGVPGEEIDPTDFENPIFSTAIELDPPESAASQAIKFNHGYSFYIDNTGTGAAASRFWLDTPDGAQVVIGPRGGSSFITDVRLRTGATTASAANMFLNQAGATYQVMRSTSSRKYKQDIEDLDLDLDALVALRPVKFYDRGEVAARERYEHQLAGGEVDPDDGTIEVPVEPREYWGLIAEEVEALGLTGFVVYGPDGAPDALMYDRMIIGALALIKQQASKIDGFEQRLAKLESGKGQA